MNLPILFNHFNPFYLFDSKRNAYNKKYRSISYQLMSIVFWIILIPVKFLDIIGSFYFFDFLRSKLIKTRKLTTFEMNEAKIVFGDSLPYSRINIRIDSKMAKIGAKSAKKTKLAFVLFRTVNFSTSIDCENNLKDMAWLIHELVHVRQFDQLGFEYIIQALRAQKNGGYDFGGEESLNANYPLKHFNLEQQADIIKFIYLLDKENAGEQKYSSLKYEMRLGEF